MKIISAPVKDLEPLDLSKATALIPCSSCGSMIELPPGFAPLRWSDEPPKEPGHYWIRVNMFAGATIKYLRFPRFEPDFPDMQWAGPIQPPE